MGVQCRPAVGVLNFGKRIPHYSRSVAVTKLEISKIGKDSVKSFKTKPHHLPTRTASGSICQGTGKGRLHKSPGANGHRSRPVSSTTSEKAKPETVETGDDKGESRPSVPSRVVQEVKTFKRNR